MKNQGRSSETPLRNSTVRKKKKNTSSGHVFPFITTRDNAIQANTNMPRLITKEQTAEGSDPSTAVGDPWFHYRTLFKSQLKHRKPQEWHALRSTNAPANAVPVGTN